MSVQSTNVDTSRASSSFPEGDKQVAYVTRRQKRGRFWAMVFMASTMVGIIALTALLYNVVNSAFGYVAIQNEIDPESIVSTEETARVLGAANLTTSEDDEVLAAGVATDPNAIGFFGYAYFLNHRDELRVLPVDGVKPNAETVDTGEYPLSRPLYIYVSEEALAEKPEVAAFIHHYLTHVNDVIGDVGYFPAAKDTIDEDLQTWAAAAGMAQPPVVTDGQLAIAGSSTVYPLTNELASGFRDAGYSGSIQIDNVGTQAGFAEFCTGDDVDIVNASRPINRGELEACRKAERTPIEFRVGNDAVAFVVSQANTFVEGVTQAELAQLFTDAESWAAVNESWPNEPVMRFAPGEDSGTLDFFVDTVLVSDLAELSKERLQTILEENVSAGLMRRFENDQPFAERSQRNVYELVVERVVEPSIVESWSLTESLFNRDEIEAIVATIPNSELSFRSWLTLDFIVSPQSSDPQFAGVRTAILGSLWVILITILFSLPIGVGAAIYLEEYARDNWFNRLIETNINNLAGVPSIIYGMLGLAIFVRALEFFTSGSLFGYGDPTTANGRTVVSAGLTLGLLILPLIIINAREAVRAVPASLRQASYGLGATKWQTIWSHVLPNALPGIMTGTILAISRAIGETAPLVVIGASTFIVVDPDSIFSKFTTLPIQIYQWTSRPQAEFRNIAAAAIIVLLILLLTLNATAVLIRNRFSRQLT